MQDITRLSKEELNKKLIEIENLSDEESLLLKAKIYYSLNNIDKALLTIIDCLNKSNKYYYEAILIKIDCLEAKKKYIEALKVLDEELSMPYIPNDYELKFKEKYKYLLSFFNQSSSENTLDNMDDKSLGELLVKTDNLEILEGIIEQLFKRNVRNILPYIKEFLLDENKNNMMKSFIIVVLNEQKIDEQIPVVKNDMNLTIVPSDLTSYQNLDAYPKILNIIDELNTNHNVTIDNIAKIGLESAILYNYPLEIDFDEYIYYGIGLYIKANKSLNIEIDSNALINKYHLSSKTLTYYLHLIENITNLC